MSCIGGPKDLFCLIHGELATIERTSTLTTLINLIYALLAEHVAARKEHLYIVAILCATPASHLRFPQLVFHARDVHF